MAVAFRKHFVFVTGVHRSGKSMLHESLRGHREMSGFAGRGKPEDEGQQLQAVVPPAKEFGGPGRFGLDETHPLAAPESAA